MGLRGEGGGAAGGGEDIGADVLTKSFGDGEAVEFFQAGGDASAGDDGGEDGADKFFRLIHQAGERKAGLVPFQHGEFVRVQGAAFGVAPDSGQLENFSRAGDEELFHREFGGGVEPEFCPFAVRGFAGGGEGFQVDFFPWGGDGVGGFDFGKAVGGEEGAGGLGEQGPPTEEGHTGGEAFGVPCRLRHFSSGVTGCQHAG